MASQMTADDILPLVAGLSPFERVRLLRLIAGQPVGNEATAYDAAPPRRDEFSADDDLLAWEADGWETGD